jgi:PPP family 3-phenylpropionic acid transporter
VGSLTDASAAESLVSHPGGAAAFGRLRLWGSVGFLVAVLGGGALFDRFGLGLVRLLTLSTLAIAAALAWLIPAPRIERRPDALSAWLGLVRDTKFRRFLVAVALAQAAAAGYDACFSLYLARLGCSKGAIGLAWAVGVVAEVIVLHKAGALVRRYGAPRLFAASIVVAAIRWSALSLVSGVAGAGWLSLPAVRLFVLALQPLHGITFGLWFVCAVHIARERGRSVPTAAQGLLAGASSLGSTLGMVYAGQLLAAGGGGLLYAVAALSAGAGAIAASGFARLAKRSPTGKLVDEPGP